MVFYHARRRTRSIQLDDLKQREETVILYEAPHRLKETLRALQTSFGGTRSIVLARELTKRFEEFLRGTLEEAVLWAESNEIRGEFCIVIEGSDGAIVEEQQEWWNDLEVREHVTELMERKGLRSKEAIREVANDRGLSRRDVYKEFHVEDE